MRLGVVLLVCLGFSVSLFAQQTGIVNSTFENVVPPSPSAAAITKFGSIPVGYSTGIPQVSVPVYTYSNKALGLTLPVSLEYHAGGVRSNEIASDVGLGWVLNAGGVITRVVRGIPDETNPSGFLHYGPLPNTELNANYPGDYTDRPSVLINSGQLDGQCDIFSFNFNGHAGQFVLGKNNDILIMPQSKIRIQYTVDNSWWTGAITGFNITDEKGYKYYFNDKETTFLTGSVYYNTYYSAWYLSKIVTPMSMDSIVFAYDSVLIHQTVGAVETRVYGVTPPTYDPDAVSQFYGESGYGYDAI